MGVHQTLVNNHLTNNNLIIICKVIDPYTEIPIQIFFLMLRGTGHILRAATVTTMTC
jgi:hypothetical protein